MNETGGLGAWSIGIDEPMLYLLLIGFVIAVFGLVKLVKVLWTVISG